MRQEASSEPCYVMPSEASWPGASYVKPSGRDTVGELWRISPALDPAALGAGPDGGPAGDGRGSVAFKTVSATAPVGAHRGKLGVLFHHHGVAIAGGQGCRPQRRFPATSPHSTAAHERHRGQDPISMTLWRDPWFRTPATPAISGRPGSPRQAAHPTGPSTMGQPQRRRT